MGIITIPISQVRKWIQRHEAHFQGYSAPKKLIVLYDRKELVFVLCLLSARHFAGALHALM